MLASGAGSWLNLRTPTSLHELASSSACASGQRRFTRPARAIPEDNARFHLPGVWLANAARPLRCARPNPVSFTRDAGTSATKPQPTSVNTPVDHRVRTMPLLLHGWRIPVLEIQRSAFLNQFALRALHVPASNLGTCGGIWPCHGWTEPWRVHSAPMWCTLAATSAFRSSARGLWPSGPLGGNDGKREPTLSQHQRASECYRTLSPLVTEKHIQAAVRLSRKAAADVRRRTAWVCGGNREHQFRKLANEGRGDAAYNTLAYVPCCPCMPVCQPKCDSPLFVWVRGPPSYAPPLYEGARSAPSH